MPRYFFSIRDTNGLIPDEEGTECGDIAAALREGHASARDLAKHYIEQRLGIMGSCIEVRDVRGALLASIPVAAALAPFDLPDGTYSD